MILPLLLMSACNGNFTDDFPESASDEKGNLIISLNADVRNENIDVRSSSGDEIPVDEFWVEIFTPGNKRLYCERYGQAKEDVISQTSAIMKSLYLIYRRIHVLCTAL